MLLKTGGLCESRTSDSYWSITAGDDCYVFTPADASISCQTIACQIDGEYFDRIAHFMDENPNWTPTTNAVCESRTGDGISSGSGKKDRCCGFYVDTLVSYNSATACCSANGELEGPNQC